MDVSIFSGDLLSYRTVLQPHTDIGKEMNEAWHASNINRKNFPV